MAEEYQDSYDGLTVDFVGDPLRGPNVIETTFDIIQSTIIWQDTYGSTEILQDTY